MKVLVGTNNPGKVAELRRLLGGGGLEVVTPAEAGVALEVEEDGTTYAANAAKKARAFAEAAKMVALADDSGLEVDALAGGPGVFSARYGGPGLDDAGRVERLLEELAAVPEAERGARFRAVIAVARPAAAEVELFEAAVEGRIGFEPRGSNGFGYDPVFMLPCGRTMAEHTSQEKDAISHRGQAARAVRAWLEGQGG